VTHKYFYSPFVVSLSNHGWKVVPFDWLRANGKCIDIYETRHEHSLRHTDRMTELQVIKGIAKKLHRWS